jgi:hypothetical protein
MRCDNRIVLVDTSRCISRLGNQFEAALSRTSHEVDAQIDSVVFEESRPEAHHSYENRYGWCIAASITTRTKNLQSPHPKSTASICAFPSRLAQEEKNIPYLYKTHNLYQKIQALHDEIQRFLPMLLPQRVHRDSEDQAATQTSLLP